MAGVSVNLQDRDLYERQVARAVGRASREEFSALMDELGETPDMSKLDASYWEMRIAALAAVLMPLLEKVFLAQTEQLLGERSIAPDWATLNERAARWAREYSFSLVKGITDKTRASLQEKIAGFYTDKRTLADLKDSIAPLFGPVRAEMIAITEVTRASAQGELAYADELSKMGLRTTQIWQTANDDRTCEICGPLNQKRQGDGWQDAPPAHPRCRCWTSTEVVHG